MKGVPRGIAVVSALEWRRIDASRESWKAALCEIYLRSVDDPIAFGLDLLDALNLLVAAQLRQLFCYHCAIHLYLLTYIQ
jgi:hypothetical protein